MHFETVFYTQHPNQGNLIQLEGNSLMREPPESTSSQGTGFGKGVGFSVLPKDTSTCGQEEPGFEPPTHGSLDELLYLSRPKIHN